MAAKTPNDKSTKLALTDYEAAEAIGVSVRTLRNWRYLTPKKGPKYARVGGRIVYPVRELEKFLADSMVR